MKTPFLRTKQSGGVKSGLRVGAQIVNEIPKWSRFWNRFEVKMALMAVGVKR